MKLLYMGPVGHHLTRAICFILSDGDRCWRAAPGAGTDTAGPEAVVVAATEAEVEKEGKSEAAADFISISPWLASVLS